MRLVLWFGGTFFVGLGVTPQAGFALWVICMGSEAWTQLAAVPYRKGMPGTAMRRWNVFGAALSFSVIVVFGLCTVWSAGTEGMRMLTVVAAYAALFHAQIFMSRSTPVFLMTCAINAATLMTLMVFFGHSHGAELLTVAGLSLVVLGYVIFGGFASQRNANELEAANARLGAAKTHLETQNIRFTAALDNMPQALSLFDSEGLLVVCNHRFLEMYQIPAEYVPHGEPLSEILSQSGVMGAKDELGRRLLALEHVAMSLASAVQLEQTWPDGRIVSIARCRIEDGGYLDTTSDISENRKAMAQIAYMARFDALTDLPNRSLYHERLTDAVQHARRGELCAVLCLDLDRFKIVNDTLGHPVGDALLIEVSNRLKSNIRDIDTVARFGGDEFALILRQLKSPDEASILAERLIHQLRLPYTLEGHNVSIGASIGISIMDVDHNDPDELIRNADVALYKAKADGRGIFRMFQPELHALLDQRRQLEVELREAMKLNQFVVDYQPQVDSRTQDITGFEALVRWRSPARGLVMPNDFIPLCEEIGLIDELGAWVLEKACTDAANWPDDISIAVNVSPVQFKADKLLPVVLRVLEKTTFDPRRLELEITENVMFTDNSNAMNTLRQLKQLGIRISLDDFGKGYSSLSYIRDFPFDRIKIDQSFIQDIGTNSDSLAIVRAVAGLCGSLGISSTAEGVETQAQFDILNTENCNSVQGYLFGRPMPLKDANHLVNNQRPVKRA